MRICLRHPERQAVTSCSLCHKPVCEECVIRQNDRVFCSKACIDYDNQDQKASQFVQQQRLLARKHLIYSLVAIVLFCIVAFWAFYLISTE